MEMTKEYMNEVCKLGQGADCCRYITVGADGLSCAKDDPGIKASIDRQVVQMRAKGDNCDGWDSYQKTFRG